jgi:mycofactocin biosynthetic radical S-adenosylmethionine protein MftC
MSGYQGFVARAWQRNHLLSALIELTYRCSWDCFICYNDLGLRGVPLTTGQHLRLLDELRSMQVINLILTGGEPLAHPDFFIIGRRARELEFAIRLKSNGHAIRGPVLRRIREEIDPQLIEVSLHGARAATHDRQTRVAGSFERLCANLTEMAAAGLRIKLNSPLTRWNEDEIEDMFALADGLGIPLQFDPEVTPRDNRDDAPLTIAPSRQAIGRLFELQRRRGQQLVAREGAGTPYVADEAPQASLQVATEKHCGAGSSVIAVDPFGTVFPCVQWRQAVGNLHRQSLAEIWTGAAVTEIRTGTVEIKRWLEREHDGGAGLAFCPGAATSNTGQAAQLYPAALDRRAAAEPASGAGGPRRLLPVVR